MHEARHLWALVKEQVKARSSPAVGIQQDTVHGREVHHYIGSDLTALGEPQIDSRTAVVSQ